MKYNFESIKQALLRLENGIHSYIDGSIISKRTGRAIGFPSGKGGYLGYTVSCNGTQKSVFIHRVVFAYFNGLEELKKHETIDHIDGDKFNNRIENLRGMSNAKNLYLAKQRLQKGNKLTFQQASEIKRLLEQGVKQIDIAETYGVSPPTITAIKQGVTFKYIK